MAGSNPSAFQSDASIGESRLSWIESLSNFTSAAAAVIAVGVATWAVMETRRLHKLQTNPEVIVYLAFDEEFTSGVNLVIENIGSGPASDVSFTWPENFPWFDLTEISGESAFILEKAIPFLAPGQKLECALDSYVDLEKAAQTVSAQYHRFGDDKYPAMTASFRLDPMMFWGLGTWGSNRDEILNSAKSALNKLNHGQVVVRIRDERQR